MWWLHAILNSGTSSVKYEPEQGLSIIRVTSNFKCNNSQERIDFLINKKLMQTVRKSSTNSTEQIIPVLEVNTKLFQRSDSPFSGVKGKKVV